MDHATPRDALQQTQFLDVLPREEAVRRLKEALRPAPLPAETVSLPALPGRVLAADVVAPVDAPPFDRSAVDGFALRAADVGAAGAGAPVRLRLNPEVIACGVWPRLALEPGTATPIATGGPIPRGADAVVMVEHTTAGDDGTVTVLRPAAPGQFVGFAGSDIARGETLLRRGTLVGSREVAMLAAVGVAEAPVVRRPRVAVISTGDELRPAGAPLAPGEVYDANGPVIAAAVAENGGEPVPFGQVRDDPEALRRVLRDAHATCDAVILSGGTSKGAGDLTYRLIGELGAPGIVAHGVALKPGKPLCLAVCGGKAVVALPGFPTSAMFTFHDVVAPVLRRLAGLPPRSEAAVEAVLPVPLASEIGRTEFVMVSLVGTEEGLAAYPTGAGSGAVTSFARADGFLTVPALTEALPAGTRAPVTLFTPTLRAPDLVVIGSHDVGLDHLASRLAERGLQVRLLAVGSLGGLAAARRGECDLAPIHLLDPASGRYNLPFLDESLELVPGWRRVQGLVFRPGDPRFMERSVEEAVAAALADPDCHLVSRNQGSGTRVLLDRLLGGARPPGYWNQPRSHNAVAASVAAGRADWGLAIEPVAEAYGLGFTPVADEHYDFALLRAWRERPAVQAFLALLAEPATKAALRSLGFEPT